MNIYYSDLCLLNNDISTNIDKLKEFGADNVEIMNDGKQWNEFEIRMESLAGVLNSKDVGYSVHAPVFDVNLTSENSEIRKASLETYKQSIVFASKINAKYVVIHPGFCKTFVFDKELAILRCKEALHILDKVSKKYSMPLLIENVGIFGSSIFTFNQFVTLLDEFDDNIGYLIDVGHAFLNGWNIPKLIKQTREKLFSLHIHDNNGKSDSHSPMYEGIIKWEEIFDALKELDHEFNIVLEYKSETPLIKLRQGKNLVEKLLKQ